MNINNNVVSTTVSWVTPPEIVISLGGFDLDPCEATPQPFKHARKGYQIHEDGLSKKWVGRVWMNPPYGRGIHAWCKKFIEHGDGIALVPSSGLDTKWAQYMLLNADAVLFLKGRILFYYPTGKQSTGKFISNMLIACGDRNVRALEDSALSGMLFYKGEQI